jgi:hypothetical protein
MQRYIHTNMHTYQMEKLFDASIHTYTHIYNDASIHTYTHIYTPHIKRKNEDGVRMHTYIHTYLAEIALECEKAAKQDLQEQIGMCHVCMCVCMYVCTRV